MDREPIYMTANAMRTLTDKVNAELIEKARNSDRYKYLFTEILESAKKGESCMYFTAELNDKYCIKALESEGFTILYNKLLTLHGGHITRVEVKW